ncbi:hypothetical protein [Jiella avicenniae]|uniref:Uncharacterized protein n=1 Tax=Jiella avicenniae TaxID=2907202 RepID=A0A9X1P3C5_9HYPH|nr:hypothetical protein [Jiella avicenniae]MCE7028984.1 hypothetical protein [Jiella avicenniae]
MAIRAFPVFFVLVPLVGLAGCGGMNRAVTTLPRTFDDLGDKTSSLRGEAAGQPSRGVEQETTGRRDGPASSR